MSTAASRLQQFYVRFGEQRFADLLELLSDDVWYIQLNSMSATTSPRGPRAVKVAYANWGRWFRDMRISEVNVTALPEEQVLKTGGAVDSFLVVYQLSGRYVRRIPGLRQPALEVGTEVSLLMTDRVWMNPRQQICRATNVFRFP